MCWSWETDPVVTDGGVTPCRYDDGCLRPLCPYQHSEGGRAVMWARVWTTFAFLEEKDIIAENTVEGAVEHIQDRTSVQMVDELLWLCQFLRFWKSSLANECHGSPSKWWMCFFDRTERVSLVPQEHVQQRFDEQNVDVVLPQIMESEVQDFKMEQSNLRKGSVRLFRRSTPTCTGVC